MNKSVASVASAIKRTLAQLPKARQMELEKMTQVVTADVKDALKKPSRRAVIELMDVVDANVDTLHSQMPPVACSAGCAYCCYQKVHVTLAELLHLTDYIQKHYTLRQMNDLRRNLSGLGMALAKMDEDERWDRKIPCPLLGKDNRCTVYPARPLACQRWTSGDAGACQATFEGKEETVPVDMKRFLLTSAIEAGVITGLEQAGLSSVMVELTFGIYMALYHPQTLDRWIDGELDPDAFTTHQMIG